VVRLPFASAKGNREPDDSADVRGSRGLGVSCAPLGGHQVRAKLPDATFTVAFLALDLKRGMGDVMPLLKQ